MPFMLCLYVLILLSRSFRVLDRTKETANLSAWYRDPTKPVPLTEITRFPHAILEVKLQLEGNAQTPEWVQNLLNSGMIMEVRLLFS